MTTRGVLAIAFGKPKYLRQAINLAVSIRLRDPDMPLAIATDFPAARFAGHFDQVIPWDFTEWPGLVSKLELYDITPFDITLFIDTDCFAITSLTAVFDYFEGQDFGVFGRNSDDPPWFRSISTVRQAVSSATYPVFNGGLYYFTRSPGAEDVFRRARRLFQDYDSLEINRTSSNRENEEPLISLAMTQAGLKATTDPRMDIIQAPERPNFHLHIDVLAGECWFIRTGRMVRPAIVHFVGVRDRLYAYRREALRLRLASRPGPSGPVLDGLVSLVAPVIWLVERLGQKLVEGRLGRTIRTARANYRPNPGRFGRPRAVTRK